MNFLKADVFTAPIEPGFLLVYADPPYAGCRFRYARRHGNRQWGRNARADFLRELIARMEALRDPDGICAVSIGSPELRLLHLFPSDTHVAAWVKPYAQYRPGVWPCYAWEPVVLWGRKVNREEQRLAKTPHDWLNVAPAKPKKGGHETPKPMSFADWVLRITLGPRRGRVLELFAGTCPVARAAEGLGMEATAVDLDDYREQHLL